MRRIEWLQVSVLALAFALPGCGSEAPEGPVGVAAPPPGGFVGAWETKGTTTDIARGDTRTLEGMVVITEKDGVFSVTSELRTQFPTEGGPVMAEVIGTGRGERDGNLLGGTAETQLVLGGVPGVAPGFAFIPRNVGPRITSTWTGHFRRDGTLVVELENVAAEGEQYSPTRTTLYGTRAAGPTGGS